VSYATIRAAFLSRMQTALGSTWVVEAGSRERDLEQYSVARVALLVHDSVAFDSLDELGGTAQSGALRWSVYLGIRQARGKDADTDLALHTALEALGALCGVILDSTSPYGPLERTEEENRSDDDDERVKWRQGWFMPRVTE